MTQITLEVYGKIDGRDRKLSPKKATLNKVALQTKSKFRFGKYKLFVELDGYRSIHKEITIPFVKNYVIRENAEVLPRKLEIQVLSENKKI